MFATFIMRTKKDAKKVNVPMCVGDEDNSGGTDGDLSESDNEEPLRVVAPVPTTTKKAELTTKKKKNKKNANRIVLTARNEHVSLNPTPPGFDDPTPRELEVIICAIEMPITSTITAGVRHTFLPRVTAMLVRMEKEDEAKWEEDNDQEAEKEEEEEEEEEKETKNEDAKQRTKVHEALCRLAQTLERERDARLRWSDEAHFITQMALCDIIPGGVEIDSTTADWPRRVQAMIDVLSNDVQIKRLDMLLHAMMPPTNVGASVLQRTTRAERRAAVIDLTTFDLSEWDDATFDEYRAFLNCVDQQPYTTDGVRPTFLARVRTITRSWTNMEEEEEEAEVNVGTGDRFKKMCVSVTNLIQCMEKKRTRTQFIAPTESDRQPKRSDWNEGEHFVVQMVLSGILPDEFALAPTATDFVERVEAMIDVLSNVDQANRLRALLRRASSSSSVRSFQSTAASRSKAFADLDTFDLSEWDDVTPDEHEVFSSAIMQLPYAVEGVRPTFLLRMRAMSERMQSEAQICAGLSDNHKKTCDALARLVQRLEAVVTTVTHDTRTETKEKEEKKKKKKYAGKKLCGDDTNNAYDHSVGERVQLSRMDAPLEPVAKKTRDPVTTIVKVNKAMTVPVYRRDVYDANAMPTMAMLYVDTLSVQTYQLREQLADALTAWRNRAPLNEANDIGKGAPVPAYHLAIPTDRFNEDAVYAFVEMARVAGFLVWPNQLVPDTRFADMRVGIVVGWNHMSGVTNQDTEAQMAIRRANMNKTGVTVEERAKGIAYFSCFETASEAMLASIKLQRKS